MIQKKLFSKCFLSTLIHIWALFLFFIFRLRYIFICVLSSQISISNLIFTLVNSIWKIQKFSFCNDLIAWKGKYFEFRLGSGTFWKWMSILLPTFILLPTLFWGSYITGKKWKFVSVFLRHSPQNDFLLISLYSSLLDN